MRLTAGRKATVVRELRRQARRFARAQDEARDRGLERCSDLPQKPVVSFHPAFSGFQNAEALVLVYRAGRDSRLLAHHPFAEYLRIHAIANRVVDQPTSRQQLRGQSADVLYAYEVGEDIVTLRRLRVISQIDGPHSDANSIGLAV